MAYRPSWQGHLKLSLVTCPVALYTATNPGGDVHFHLINPATNFFSISREIRSAKRLSQSRAKSRCWIWSFRLPFGGLLVR